MPTDLEIRERRREAILQVVRQHKVRDQAQLLILLRQKGITATQPSISRDLQELGIRRVNGIYVQEELPTLDDTEFRRVAGFIRRADRMGPHMTLVKTQPGAAKVVAVAIDAVQWPEVGGTIAGEDTILVATANLENQDRLIRRLGRSLV
jgi:transcriptional regulator of arginine metabolism